MEIMSLGTAASSCKTECNGGTQPQHINRYKKGKKNKLCCSDHTVYSPALLFACEYERYLLCPSANIVLLNADGCISCGLAALILSGTMFSVLTGDPPKGRSFTSASSFEKRKRAYEFWFHKKLIFECKSILLERNLVVEGPSSSVETMSPLWKYSSLKCAMESDPPHEMMAPSGVSPCTKDWCLSEVSMVFPTSASKIVLNMRRRTPRYFSVKFRPMFPVLFMICTFHAAFQGELNMKYILLFSQHFNVPLFASKYCWVLASMCVWTFVQPLWMLR